MFKRIINELKSIGVSPDTPSFELRKIRLLTYISITCISTALFYSLLFFFLGETIPAILDFLLVILFLPSLILNKFKKHALAKYLLIINTNIAILLVIIVYGQMYRNELFFIISSMLGIIIFKNKKNGIISFLIAMVFFIVSKILLANTNALYPTDENLTFPLSIIGLISVAFIAYLLISYIKNETIDYESKIITAFENNVYDESFIIYNSFKNAAVQELINEKFLPVEPIEDSNVSTSIDYIFEPNQEEILNDLIPNSLKIKFYKALLDSFASEHGARMTAMHKATDNASEMKKELTLFYNKARQASITSEILEIVAGAEALGG